MKIKWTLLIAIIIWTISCRNYELCELKKGERIPFRNATGTHFYTIDRCIGSGASAVVYADNAKWALKMPKYKNENLSNEIEIVNYLVTKTLEAANPNSTKDISLAYHLIYFENVGLCGRCQLSIVQMPLLGMSLKCLKSQLMSRSPLHPYLPSLTVYFWAIQMMVALRFLHSVGIVHCDLKLCNLVLEKDYNWSEIMNQETNLIIIDFDSARFTDAKNSASNWRQPCQGPRSKIANDPPQHTFANGKTVNGINNDAEIGPIDRRNDMLMVEKSLSQFIHPTERFGDIFTDVEAGAWHCGGVPFGESLPYGKVISNIKRRIDAPNSPVKS